ncbi:MAG: hypothetical protein SFX72_18530 [Isosphaeraceae bacterium]|nr:hypothetical protein [Isosphaeraceae bacterium]
MRPHLPEVAYRDINFEGSTLMIHYTCDLCGKDLTASGEQRFVVKIEVCPRPVSDEAALEELDVDPMEKLTEILMNDQDLTSEELAAQGPRGYRYDLCPRCHGRFAKDPLGRESVRALDFSKN